MNIIQTDLLCIGAGLAGERVAIEAADNGFSVICLSIVPARRSHSSAAQGGMQAALGNSAMGEGDSPDVHFADTVKGSDWGCDQEVARLFVNAAPIAMRQMAFWGVPWNRVVPGEQTYYKGGKPFTAYEKPENAGLIHSRNFGGTAKWRTCYTSDGYRALRALHARQPGRPDGRQRRGQGRGHCPDPRRVHLHGRHCPVPQNRRADRVSGPGHAHCHGWFRSHLPRVHQRRDLRRRRAHLRPGHRRGAAWQHGGCAVPPDRHRADRHSGDRRLPGRRRHLARQERIPVHARLRAGKGRARLPRRGARGA